MHDKHCAATKSNNHNNDHLKIIFPHICEQDELKHSFIFRRIVTFNISEVFIRNNRD